VFHSGPAFFLRANADTYHVDANNIGVIGASAGGQLAGLVAYTDPNAGLEPNALLYPGVTSSRVQAFVDLYGVVDQWTRHETATNGEPNLATWKWGTSDDMLACLPTDCPEKWDASNPVFYITPDDPNTLILHGTADTTVDYYQSTTLNSKLDANGVPNTLHLLPGVNHSFSLTDTGTGTEVITFFDNCLKH
jgi:acetyl esterase/lipase